MSERERLQNKRRHELIDFQALEGVQLTAGVGKFADGRIAELFLDTRLTGSSLDTLVREIAVTFSIAAQCGGDVDIIRRALPRDARGQAQGPLGIILDKLAAESAR